MAPGPLNALGRHLALAGFMGSGKTTVGAVVAERLGRTFVDLDDEIERRAGTAIADLFSGRRAPLGAISGPDVCQTAAECPCHERSDAGGADFPKPSKRVCVPASVSTRSRLGFSQVMFSRVGMRISPPAP